MEQPGRGAILARLACAAYFRMVFPGRPSSSETQTFSYLSGDCTGPLGSAVTTDLNDCTYLITLEPGATTGPAPQIKCPAGKEMTFTVGELCTIHTPAQTPDGIIAYSNKGAGTTREVTISSSISGIDATRTGSALCGAATSATGTLEGDVTLTGEKSGTKNHTGIWVEDAKFHSESPIRP